MEIRSLTEAEVRPRGRPKGAVAKIREVHHLVARLYAKGMKPPEIAALVNRTPATIRNWLGSPANAELVAQYEKESSEEIISEVEYAILLKRRLRTLADEELLELIEAEPDKFSIKDLIALSADSSDRTGLGKQSVQVNINLDLKSRMEQAKKRLVGLDEARAAGKVVDFVRRG